MSALQIALLLLLSVVTYPCILITEWAVRRGMFKPVYDVPVTPE